MVDRKSRGRDSSIDALAEKRELDRMAAAHRGLSRDATLSLLAEARLTLEQVCAELLGHARESGSRFVGYVLSTLDDLDRAVQVVVPPDG